MDSNAKVQRYLADLNSPTTSPTSPNEGKLKGFRGPGQAAHDPLQFVAPPSTANLAERAKKLVTLTEEQKRIREIELDAAPRKMNEEESWQADLDTWRKKRKNRLSSEEPTDKGYGSGTSQPENDYRITPSLKTVEQSEIHDYNSFNYTKQTSNEDYSRSGYGSLEKHMYSMSTANQEDRKPTNGDLGYGNTDSTDEHDYEILRTAEELPYTKQQNVTEVRYSYSERHDPESVQYPTSENYGSRDQRNRYEDYSSRTGNYGNEEKKYGTNVESIISHYKPMKQFDDYEKINISKSQTDEEFIRNKYGMENKQAVTGDAKEEILTITSPSGDDSGIENRNSSSQSPSTSFDFSPRSADPISPKGQQFHPARSSSPTAPNYAPPPPPTSELDQVLIPVSTSHISRSIPKDEPVDYPPPPEHLRTPSSERKTFGTHSEEILSPNRARAFASFPAASSLREHTKVEPFVAQSIRDHNQSGEKSVELTVELNREQKAVVSATKFPGRREKYTPSSEEESTEEKPDSPVEARQSRQTSRDTYSSYSSKPVASVRSSIQSRTISSDSSKYQPLSRLSQSVSTPNVAAPLPSQPSNMSTTVYRAVDIPFDDSAATYQPPRMNKDGLVCMVIEMGAQPVHKGFGFTINCERRKCLVDGVIVGTPADKHGLLIGDRIDSINGESVADKYPSAINRMLHESARLGEVQLMIQRKDVRLLYGSTPNLNAPRTTGSKFDETRNVFKEKPESYSEFKRKHTKARNEPHPLPRDFNSLPRSSSSSTTQYDSLPRRRDASANSSYRTARQSFESLQSAHTGPDYRVSSLHEKSGPGKLTDFVPEVERKKEETYSSRRSYGSSEEPRTIRNYEVLPPRHETSNTKVFKSASTASTDSSTTLAMPTRSTLPRKSSSHHEEQHADDDTVPGKSYLRKNLRQLSVSPSPPSILKRSREFEDTDEIYDTVSRHSHQEPFNYISPRSRCFYSSEDISVRKEEDTPYAKPKTVHYHDIHVETDKDREYEQEFEEMYRKKPYHTVGAYGTAGSGPGGAIPIPVEHIRTRNGAQEEPRQYSRARSSDHLQTREYRERRGLDISDVSHRFYDKEGKYVLREPREAEHWIDIKREYEPKRVPDYARYEEKEKNMWIRDRVESRDWRDVINQQRQPAPGQKTDTQRIKEVTASMSNLPSIMDRKQEEIRKLQRENADYQYKSYDRKNEQPHQVYERTEYGIYEKRFSPEPYTPQHYNSLKYSEPLADKKNNYASNYEDKATSYNDYRRNYGSEPRKEHTFNQQASNYRDQSTVHREQSSYATKQREQSNYKEQSMISEQSSKVKEEIKREPENKESVVAISGKHKCAHCGEELGRGAAMIVESLGLYYHLACFKCYVCKTPLGSGTTGADVRVREGRLHCQSCYSNDRLQLSKV